MGSSWIRITCTYLLGLIMYKSKLILSSIVLSGLVGLSGCAVVNTLFPNNCYQDNSCNQVDQSGAIRAGQIAGSGQQVKQVNTTTTITHVGGTTFIDGPNGSVSCNTIGNTVFCN